MKSTIVKNGEIVLDEYFLKKEEADLLFDLFQVSLPFHQGSIKLFGRTHLIPRLEAFFATEKKKLFLFWKNIANPFFYERIS